MFDLLAAAYQADVTRVFTFMMSRELSQRTYPQIGVTEQHHSVSHHQNNAEKMAKVVKINTYYVGLFAKFLEKLRATEDGDGSLLDHSLICLRRGHGRFEFACVRSTADRCDRRRRGQGPSACSGSGAHAGGMPVVDRGESVRRVRWNASATAREWSMGFFRRFAVALRVLAASRSRLRRRRRKTPAASQVEADGTTPLHGPFAPNDLAAVQRLLRSGANPSAANRYGITPLSLAAENGNAAMVELLLKAGADPKAILPGGQTLLMTARAQEMPES